MIHMKCQDLFFRENKKKKKRKSRMMLVTVLLSTLRAGVEKDKLI